MGKSNLVVKKNTIEIRNDEQSYSGAYYGLICSFKLQVNVHYPTNYLIIEDNDKIYNTYLDKQEVGILIERLKEWHERMK